MHSPSACSMLWQYMAVFAYSHVFCGDVLSTPMTEKSRDRPAQLLRRRPRAEGSSHGDSDCPAMRDALSTLSPARSSRRWHRSDVFSRFASDPSYGTCHSSVRSSPGCRPAVLHGARRGPCRTSIRAGIRRGVRAGYVPQVGKVAAASPSGRLTTRSARRRWLERRRCACLRSCSPR